MKYEQYYPTPADLGERLAKMIELPQLPILEPSAGTGNLIQAMINAHSSRWGRYSTNDFHCVELNPERAATLKGNDFIVIWDDFLTFKSLMPYRTIIMNPPFHDRGTRQLRGNIPQSPILPAEQFKYAPAYGGYSMSFRQRNQKQIRQYAYDAAEYVLAAIDLTALDDEERDILTDITFRLLLRYFNGRELELLSKDYLIAEAADTMLERNAEISNLSAMQAAVAQIAVALGKFFIDHDTEEQA